MSTENAYKVLSEIKKTVYHHQNAKIESLQWWLLVMKIEMKKLWAVSFLKIWKEKH